VDFVCSGDTRFGEGVLAMMERTQIECHACGCVMTVEFDMSLNGNHVVECACGHQHCRVVKDGKVTDIRWDQRNGVTYNMNVIFTSSTASNSTADIFLNCSWSSSTSVYSA